MTTLRQPRQLQNVGRKQQLPADGCSVVIARSALAMVIGNAMNRAVFLHTEGRGPNTALSIQPVAADRLLQTPCLLAWTLGKDEDMDGEGAEGWGKQRTEEK